MANRVGVDWDDTLVDARSQEWLPGAQAALKRLRTRGYDVFIHTCRANWPEGRASIEAKLAASGLGDIEVIEKPSADFYIDNLGVHFDGDWPSLLGKFEATKKAMRDMRLLLDAR